VFWRDGEELSFTCLVDIILVIDGSILEWKILENVKLTNIHKFEVKSKYGRITSSEIHQTVGSYRFETSYETLGNRGNDFEDDLIDDFSFQDFVDVLVLDKRGEFHPWKVAGGVTTVIVLICVICTGCCCCSAKLHNLGMKCVPPVISNYCSRPCVECEAIINYTNIYIAK
jgi:hypothetical protein